VDATHGGIVKINPIVLRNHLSKNAPWRLRVTDTMYAGLSYGKLIVINKQEIFMANREGCTVQVYDNFGQLVKTGTIKIPMGAIPFGFISIAMADGATHGVLSSDWVTGVAYLMDSNSPMSEEFVVMPEGYTSTTRGIGFDVIKWDGMPEVVPYDFPTQHVVYHTADDYLTVTADGRLRVNQWAQKRTGGKRGRNGDILN
jgi:hypothetical protein